MIRRVIALAALSLIGCAHALPAPSVAPPKVALSEEEIDRAVQERLAAKSELSFWKPMAGNAMYLAPRSSFVDADGGFDVIVHFHGGMLIEKEWRKSGTNAVVVSAAYAQSGTTPYRDAFADANRFGAMLDDLTKRVNATHVRRLALVSWSAGYAATERILREARYYAMVDTVVLLDGLHADYTEGHKLDTAALRTFERFARDAASGLKTMAIVHSSIIPPDYASTTETAAFLCDTVGAERVPETRANERGMVERYHADRGGFHVRGFRGEGPKDHMNQLSLVGGLTREHIVTRWARLDVIARHEAQANAARTPSAGASASQGTAKGSLSTAIREPSAPAR